MVGRLPDCTVDRMSDAMGIGDLTGKAAMLGLWLFPLSQTDKETEKWL